jgi:ABC-2 type transport system ATP-binding protein
VQKAIVRQPRADQVRGGAFAGAQSAQRGARIAARAVSPVPGAFLGQGAAVGQHRLRDRPFDDSRGWCTGGRRGACRLSHGIGHHNPVLLLERLADDPVRDAAQEWLRGVQIGDGPPAQGLAADVAEDLRLDRDDGRRRHPFAPSGKAILPAEEGVIGPEAGTGKNTAPAKSWYFYRRGLCMIEIKKLVKRFGPFTAVDGVSFSVQRGEVLGFLGPNGAGKSTTMKMATGYLTPTAGSAVICGHDVVNDPQGVKEKIGYLPEGAPAYPDMTPESFLNFIAQVRGLRGAARRDRINEVMAKVHLEGVMRQTIDTLSKGFKRRVGLAQAILHDPDVLIMDEPTDGLDPNQKHEVRSLIKDMAPNKAIVLSTHILEEVEAVCTRAVIISRGRIVADGTPAQLQARSRYHNAVAIKVKSGLDAAAVRAELSRVSGVSDVEESGASANGRAGFMVFPKGGRAIVSEVSQAVRGKGWEIDELHVEAGRLDEVFRTITAAEGGAS